MAFNWPVGTVTFLFTDIESSTRLWEQSPAAMQAALARHDDLLRDCIAAHGGRVIKRTGDGLYAVFAHAPEGVAATLDCQRALESETWPALPSPLRVRMGLHTGEAEFRDGDYFGSTLNRTARLISIASGGQVLLSAITAELVRDRLPDGAVLRDLGEHRLKDLIRPERVFQLTGPGVASDFAPLRSLNTLPNNLPVQLTSFVGREQEKAEVKRLLATTRLLTLTGSGGTGKTRLSLQVAADALDTFVDGAWLVELAPLSDPALVTQMVASTWGVREQRDRPLLDCLIDYLHPKALLLVLDNCEHLIDECARLVTALLRACPRLKILPSSREALGVEGESVYRVPSLSLPLPSQSYSVDGLSRFESVQLFVQRAQAAQSRFALTAHNLGAIAQICRRLDGIPLALELAAARVKLLTVEQIAARLDDRFRLLTGGSRTALPRQQTLRALIDWSYDLLPALERGALARLAVFAGGWTFDAAEAIIGPDALDLLAHLVDKSLIAADEYAQADETRYHLLETVRQYARDKLLESGESSPVRDLHLGYYLRLAETAEPKLVSREIVRAFDQLETELDNIRAALEWALERNPESAVRIASALAFFWRIRGRTTEGHRWLRDALDRFDALPLAQGDAARRRLALRAKTLFGTGLLAFGNGELNAARAWLEKAASLARDAGEMKTLAISLSMLGLTAVWLGDEAGAEAVIAEGASVARATNDRFTMGMILTMQAAHARLLHHYDAAQTYLEQSLQPLRELGNPWFTAIPLMGLAEGAALQGRYDEALARYRECEALFGEIGDRQSAISAMSYRAHIERQLGHYAEALSLYSKTLPGWQELGVRAALAHELECFAFIAATQSHAHRAARLLGAAENLREAIDAPMTSLERAEYDEFVPTLRAQLSGEAFAAAWAGGRAMTVDQAIAVALEEPERVRC